MRIDKLQINNFRKFKELDLNFKPGVNILIGDNAAGKTSVLESLKILIGSYFYGINSKHVNSPSIHRTKDVQFLQDENGKFSRIYPTQVKAEGKVFNEQVCWSRELRTAKGASTTAGLSDLKKIVSVHENDVLPIVAFYSTARFNVESRDSSPYKNDERYAAYKNALNANSSISAFVQWFENQDRISYQYKERTYALNVVSDAIMNCLPNCKRVFYDAKLTDILIEDENNVVTPFSLMSEGYRLITSLIGDLAYRCAILNSLLEADCLRETTGVVLIDEIETHLHPSWQQRVVNDLHRTFPKIQFIISTHSPIVLSGVQANVIRLSDNAVADDFITTDSDILTYGRRPEYIMYSEQGVLARTHEVQIQIDEFYSLVETKEGLKDAKKILDNLFIAQFGENDPDTVRAVSDYEFALMEFDEED